MKIFFVLINIFLINSALSSDQTLIWSDNFNSIEIDSRLEVNGRVKIKQKHKRKFLILRNNSSVLKVFNASNLKNIVLSYDRVPYHYEKDDFGQVEWSIDRKVWNTLERVSKGKWQRKHFSLSKKVNNQCQLFIRFKTQQDKPLSEYFGVDNIELRGENNPSDKICHNELPTLEKNKKWNMVFNDEFNGKKLDLTKWSHSAENEPRREGYWRSDAAFLDGKGHLKILIYKDDKDQYASGSIHTKGKFDTKYGFYEARIKVQKELGHWSAFWLWPNELAKPGALEIDIFEKGFQKNKAQNALHFYKPTGHSQKVKRYKLPHASPGWHLFSAWWKPNEIIFYFNGKETWRKSIEPSESDAHLIISDEIGKWAHGNIKKANLPDEWFVDYVRAYSQVEK